MNPTRPPLVVGLRGLAGAGKTTIAGKLSDITLSRRAVSGHYRGPRLFPVSMAGLLKGGLAVMGITKDETPELYRRFAQEIGAACRARDPEHWVKAARRHIHEIHDRGLDVVIDDIRYPNEAALCTHIFFVEPEFPAADLGDRASHESEAWNRQGPSPTDLVVRNPSGDPDRAAREILQRLEAAIAPVVGEDAA